MSEIYLFDWGDTLMVDLKGFPGKMCEWDTVEAVDGAFDTLECLSKNHGSTLLLVQLIQAKVKLC